MWTRTSSWATSAARSIAASYSTPSQRKRWWKVEQTNGDIVPMPAIVLTFDFESQKLDIQITNSFKTIDMAMAVLRMALDELEDKRRIMKVAAMQQQAQQAAQAQNIANALDPKNIRARH